MTTPPTNVWQALPDGQDVLLQAGYYYAVLAMVDVPQSKIDSMASGYGLQITPGTYIDNVDPSTLTPPLPAAKSGYRYVAGQAVAQTGGGVVPWSVPSPWSLFDSSTLIHAWAAPPPGNTAPLPTLSCPPKPSWVPAAAAGAVAGAVVGELAHWLLKRRRQS